MALAAVLASCGGGSGPIEPPPANKPVATLVASATTIRLGESITLTGSCAFSSSAVRSWNPGGSPMDVSEVVTPTAVGTVKYTFTCTGPSGSSTAEVTITVLPPLQISGKFATYNSGLGNLGELRVYTIGSLGTDSADVNPDGSWSVKVSSPDDASIILASDAKDISNRKFFRWEIDLPKARWGGELLYSRVPVLWQFASGAYVGQSRIVSLHWDGFNPDSPAGTLLFGSKRQSGCWQYNLQTWPQFPVPMAFDRERSTDPVGPSDSIAYWQRLNALESELGWDAWRPANFSEMGYAPPVSQGGPDTWSGVLVRVGPNANGVASSEKNSADLVQGIVNSPIWAFGLPQAANHETVHAFGLGHTNWPSLMFFSSNQQDPELQILGVRTTSVIGLLYADGNAVRSLGTGARSGIPGSQMGERRTLGLPVEPICHDSPS